MAKASQVLLRVAIAFAFAYPAYGFWSAPQNWIGYVPPFVQNAGLPQETLLLILAGFHVIIALWILSGWRIFIPSLIAALFLGSVAYFNWNQLDILFRDISLMLAAVSLAFSARHS